MTDKRSIVKVKAALNRQSLEVYQLATPLGPLVVVEPDVVIKICQLKGSKSLPVCTELEAVFFFLL